MKPIFTRETFEDKIQEAKRLGTYSYEVVDIADVLMIANKTIQKLIDASPVVYGMGDDRENFNKWRSPHHTHQALLMFIEPIVKKECEHAPSVETCIVRGDGLLKEFSTSGKCKHCGIELKATWEPVK